MTDHVAKELSMHTAPPPHGAARSARLIAAVLVAATVFFVWGTLAERSDHHEPTGATTTHREGGASETSEQRAAEGGSDESTTEWRPLGIDLESALLVIAAVIASLGLAALVFFRSNRLVLAGVVVLGGAFTVLEIVEVAHQTDVDEAGLVALAAIAGVLHAAAALLAARALLVEWRAPSTA
jgi:hypothetical protein